MCVMVTDSRGKPISDRTLRKYFARELAEGSVKANVKVAQALFRQAEKGSVAAIIFWLKTRGGWKESPQAVELTGKDGGPVSSISTVTNDPVEAARIYAQLMNP